LPDQAGGQEVDGLQPRPVVVDSLPLERCVVDNALHDELAAGTAASSRSSWPISATLRMPDSSLDLVDNERPRAECQEPDGIGARGVHGALVIQAAIESYRTPRLDHTERRARTIQNADNRSYGSPPTGAPVAWSAWTTRPLRRRDRGSRGRYPYPSAAWSQSYPAHPAVTDGTARRAPACEPEGTGIVSATAAEEASGLGS
jgi:hypothetical protein